MSTATPDLTDATLHGRRRELIALSNQLREAHSLLLEASHVLKQESEWLSIDSRLLRLRKREQS